MPQVIITFKPPLENFARAIKSVEISSLVSSEINKLAMGVVRFGRQLSPVDTGLMRSRINQTYPSTPSTLKALVETGTHYSIYVHEGTRYMRGRPFLERGTDFALENFTGNISGRLEKGFVEAFKRLH